MPLIKDEKPIEKKEEVLPTITEEASVLITKANISETKLQQDLHPYAEEDAPKEKTEEEKLEKVIATISSHHLECAYSCLIRGEIAEVASKIANIPLKVSQKLIDEIVAVRTKLSTATPISKKPVVVAAEVPTIEKLPLDKPIKE